MVRIIVITILEHGQGHCLYYRRALSGSLSILLENMVRIIVITILEHGQGHCLYYRIIW
jgi:hypothetical protein